MKICPKCNIEHTKKGTYCSRSCGNVRVWTTEQNEKRRIKIKQWHQNMPVETKKKIDAGRNKSILRSKIKWKIYRDVTSTENLNVGAVRKKLLDEQSNLCAECGISEWKGKPLTLELDHIDGNKQNNVRENLRMLCPNCHSQTPTWRGRNNARQSE